MSKAFELITTHYFQLRSILLRLIAHNGCVVGGNVCTVVKNELTQNQTHGNAFK